MRPGRVLRDPPRVSILEVEWGEPLLQRTPDPELAAKAREGGRVNPATDVFVPVPWLYLAANILNRRLLRLVWLDHDLADLSGLVISQDNSCRYCYAVQRMLLTSVGFAEERIAKLEETFLLAELGPRERAALEFARRVSRSNPLVTRADLEPLRAAGLSDEEVQELCGLVALNLFFNRISTIPANPTAGWEALPDRWYVRWFRPIVSLYIQRGVRGRAKPLRLEAQEREGPFAYLTNALDGHPVARELRQTLDAMWASPVTPPLTRALCFAVVARALGAERAEREATELARGEGLSADEVADVLANLASPRLDPVSALAVPFSRQTVWYDVPDLQRRARALHGEIDREGLPRDRGRHLARERRLPARLPGMTLPLWVVAALPFVVATLAVLWWRSRRQAEQLTRRLRSAPAKTWRTSRRPSAASPPTRWSSA